MKNNKHPLIIGTFILTITGIVSRIIGFFYRIFLSRTIGAEAIGIYQLIFPVFGVCFSLCCGAVQTSLSRFVAGEIAAGRKKNSRTFLLCSLLLSLSLAFSASAILFYGSDFLAETVLMETRCAPLLRILSFTIPMSAIHACISGYYYGRQKAAVPAFAQLIEQLARVSAVFIMADMAQAKRLSLNVRHVVIAMVIGEFAALLFNTLSISLHFASDREPAKEEPAFSLSFRSCFCKLISLAMPLTCTRLTISFLQSAEAIFIPERLGEYGMTSTEALSIYGVLTGMALPFILFPTAITNSLAVMLLPDIARAQSVQDTKRINRTTGSTISYSLYIGFLFTGIFLSFGQDIGTVIYAEKAAGEFMVTLAWLCPFLYLSTTLNSIINGLGKARTTFIHTVLSLGIRLLFVLFLIPVLGIRAYLYALLASELLLTGLHFLYLKKSISFHLFPIYHLFRPMGAMAGAMWSSQVIERAVIAKTTLPALMKLGLTGLWFGLFYVCILYITRNSKH